MSWLSFLNNAVTDIKKIDLQEVSEKCEKIKDEIEGVFEFISENVDTFEKTTTASEPPASELPVDDNLPIEEEPAAEATEEPSAEETPKTETAPITNFENFMETIKDIEVGLPIDSEVLSNLNYSEDGTYSIVTTEEMDIKTILDSLYGWNTLSEQPNDNPLIAKFLELNGVKSLDEITAGTEVILPDHSGYIEKRIQETKLDEQEKNLNNLLDIMNQAYDLGNYGPASNPRMLNFIKEIIDGIVGDKTNLHSDIQKILERIDTIIGQIEERIKEAEEKLEAETPSSG
jgi:hypothetical protein